MLQPLTEDELNGIYNWVDQIPLSKPKKNIARDFSDGLLMSEIIQYFLPKLIDVILTYTYLRFTIIVKPIQLNRRNTIGKP